MPVYDYKCNDCGNKYDIYFKVRENKEEIECPSCKSKSAKKLMTSASISGFSSGISNYEPPSGSGGSCATGNCPFV